MTTRYTFSNRVAGLVAVIGVAVAVLGCALVHRRLSRPPRPSYAAQQADIYASLPAPGAGSVVFLGDSILDNGEWGELIPGAVNRAIGGATTVDVVKRVKDIGVPSTVVLSVGVNDLMQGRPVPEAINKYQWIIRTLQWQGARVLCVPILPVNEAIYERVLVPHYPRMKQPKAADVAEFNAAIARLDVTMLNPPVLINGQLSERYTLDGLHLNGAGLVVLAETIKQNL